MGKRKSASWMYMSRLAAEKEYAFLKVSILRAEENIDGSSLYTGPVRV